MKTRAQLQLEDISDPHFFCAEITPDGYFISASKSIEKNFICDRNLLGKHLSETSFSLWHREIKDDIKQAIKNGQQINYLWFIDDLGRICRYLWRYSFCQIKNCVFIIWFEVGDRFNRLITTYDRKRNRFGLWNGSQISAKELRTLAYFFQGLSYEAIAMREHISKAAISARLQKIAEKTGFSGVPAMHEALYERIYERDEIPQLLEVI